jgi:malate synthase
MTNSKLVESFALEIRPGLEAAYPDVYTPAALEALAALSPLDENRRSLMQARIERRLARARGGQRLDFLEASATVPGTDLTAQQARDGQFAGSEIPADLQRQWVQGTGPGTRPGAPLEKALRNVAYALLSGADGWMFDGEDALGQVSAMSLDNQRNLKLAIDRDARFMKVAAAVAAEMNAWARGFLGRPIVDDHRTQLGFTTTIFRARGLHLDDRHVRWADGMGFSASIVDAALYVVNNHERLRASGASIVLYLPKIQTAEEAALWNRILSTLEEHLSLPAGTIKVYVLVEQLEAAFQLMEIRAALGRHFVGFNTGRWDYINSVSDAMAWDTGFVNPNIDAIVMTYGYMRNYEDRVRRAVNTPDQNGRFALWQGGMEPNIPVGSQAGVQSGMKRAVAGAEREQREGASGKWVAHWKMVHIVRPVWERAGEENQLGRPFPPLGYGVADAAALKPADFFGQDDVLYLMEDMATGEIRLSILWEWLHKGAKLTDGDAETARYPGDVFSAALFDRLLDQEYTKLQEASDRDVHDDSKATTLPIAREIVRRYVTSPFKAPWYIDLLNVNLGVRDLPRAQQRIEEYLKAFAQDGTRITRNLDFDAATSSGGRV